MFCIQDEEDHTVPFLSEGMNNDLKICILDRMVLSGVKTKRKYDA